MQKGKHKISRAQAKKYVDDFDKRKKEHPNEFNGIPAGFVFDADDVKTLLSPPDSVYFMIKFGWKKTKMHDGTEKEMIAPILTALNKAYEIINPDSVAAQNPAPATRALALAEGDEGEDEEGGGYLDEGRPVPPPF